MTRSHLFGALVLATLALAACSGGSEATKYDPATADQSELDSGVKAPPVPRDVTTTTAAGTPTTAADVVQTTATGKVYYVATNGKDGAKGTAKDPWKSIETSIGKLAAGDTLLVQPGTYDGGTDDTGFMIKGVNGTAAKPITIAAATTTKPKLTGGEWKTVGIEDSSYLVLRGFETEGSALVDKKPTSGIELRKAHHITITGNYVHDGGGGGIGTNESNHVDIIGNYVSGMAKWNPFQTSGISLFESRDIGGAPADDGYSMRIIGNTVYGSENITLPYQGGNVVTDGNCIIVDSSDVKVYPGRTYIANNVCTNNGGRGIHVFQAGNVLAVNNTLYHNMQTAKLKDDGGELSAVAATDVVFRNNLVVARSDRKAVHDHQNDGVSLESNLYQEDGKGNGNGNGKAKGKTDEGEDLQVGDVGLTAPDQGDFSLRPGSPAIDNGMTDGAPATDVRGNKRSGKPDIGAFEAAS